MNLLFLLFPALALELAGLALLLRAGVLATEPTRTGHPTPRPIARRMGFALLIPAVITVLLLALWERHTLLFVGQGIFCLLCATASPRFRSQTGANGKTA